MVRTQRMARGLMVAVLVALAVGASPAAFGATGSVATQRASMVVEAFTPDTPTCAQVAQLSTGADSLEVTGGAIHVEDDFLIFTPAVGIGELESGNGWAWLTEPTLRLAYLIEALECGEVPPALVPDVPTCEQVATILENSAPLAVRGGTIHIEDEFLIFTQLAGDAELESGNGWAWLTEPTLRLAYLIEALECAPAPTPTPSPTATVEPSPTAVPSPTPSPSESTTPDSPDGAESDELAETGPGLALVGAGLALATIALGAALVRRRQLH
ncbi:hypothetical protein [Demequina sp.]|uniref:hypothetical protein n=1 Tax=Demequina sp. TaxID=2050685 RepID=UPI003A885F0F